MLHESQSKKQGNTPLFFLATAIFFFLNRKPETTVFHFFTDTETTITIRFIFFTKYRIDRIDSQNFSVKFLRERPPVWPNVPRFWQSSRSSRGRTRASSEHRNTSVQPGPLTTLTHTIDLVRTVNHYYRIIRIDLQFTLDHTILNSRIQHTP